jgi:peptidoglycan/xylan/chitin deacetylase (PgdA/CDA1 family)/uncharacterized protein involved in high-affinity Fe2+ transport
MTAWSALAAVPIVLCGCASAPGEPTESIAQPINTVPWEIAFETRPSYVPSNSIALTFDDGPDLVNTPLVLDVLKAKNVKATFFVNTDNTSGATDDGPNAPALKALIQRIVNEGHGLGNHTVHHFHLPEESSSTIEAEITGVQTTVSRADVLGPTWPPLTLFRAPFGEPYQSPGPGSSAYFLVSPIVAKYAVEIGWAIDTFDYTCVSGTMEQRKQCVVSGFTSRAGSGDYGVVLMHSIHPQTAAAIGDIIDYCNTHGLVLRRVEDFVGAKFDQVSKSLIYGGCVEEPYFGSAPTLPGVVQAENFDVGGQGCASSDATATNEGGAYRGGTRVDIEPTLDTGGGYNVGWILAGEWLKYTVDVTVSGTYNLTFRVAAPALVSTAFHLEDETGANLTGSMTVPSTGDWEIWTSVVKAQVPLTAGRHVYKLVADAGNWNINYFQASLSTCATSPFGGTSPALPGVVEAENYDNGGEGCAYHDSDAVNSGGSYRPSEGVDVEPTSDLGTGFNVGWIVSGEWMKYSVDSAPGTYDVTFRVAAVGAVTNAFHLEDETGRNLTGVLSVPNTGSWTTFTDVKATGVSLSAGNHVVRFVVDTGGFNLNRMTFVSTCATETDAAFCARLGKNCGSVSGTDNCGAPRDVASCGTCGEPNTCGAGGVANVCGCTPESDAELCARQAANCGALTATDRCGASRTIASCGTCVSPQVCGGAGTLNACALVPERTEGGAASATGTACASTQGPIQAYDNHMTSAEFTKWCVTSRPFATAPISTMYDFAGTTAFAVTRYTITTADNFSTRDPRSWKLQGCQGSCTADSDTGWVTLDTRTSQFESAARFQTNTYSIANATAYQQYRFRFTANRGATRFQLAEIQMFER